MRLETTDFDIALKSAQASLTQARANFAEEQARGEAAIADWRRLGRSGQPGAAETLRQRPLS